MAAGAIWKGNLRLGTTTLPVELYSAVVDKAVRFHILEDRTRNRVKQHMVNPELNDEVPNSEIQKGYQVEPGTYVILRGEELAKLKPKPSRDIRITRFIPSGVIPGLWYGRPYYLGPGGNEGAYSALVEALANRQAEGIAHWVMRGREYVGSLLSRDNCLMLITLHHKGEVISAEELPSRGEQPLDKKELAMARQLVGMLDSEFDPNAFKDEYRNRVLDLIEMKAKGSRPRLHAVKTKRATSSLERALSKSIATIRKQRENAAA